MGNCCNNNNQDLNVKLIFNKNLIYRNLHVI